MQESDQGKIALENSQECQICYKKDKRGVLPENKSFIRGTNSDDSGDEVSVTQGC